jgi:hypothetical protein
LGDDSDHNLKIGGSALQVVSKLRKQQQKQLGTWNLQCYLQLEKWSNKSICMHHSTTPPAPQQWKMQQWQQVKQQRHPLQMLASKNIGGISAAI